jgi:uncharacterized membrane protein
MSESIRDAEKTAPTRADRETADSVPASGVKNVGGAERVASAVAGGLLVALGLRNRTAGGLAAAAAGGGLLYRGLTGHCHLYGALGLSSTADGHPGAGTRAAEVSKSITIEKPADELRRLWTEPGTLPRIFGFVGGVSSLSDGRYRWSLRGPLGMALEYQTRTTEDAGGTVRWESVEGADLPNEGAVTFRPATGGRGTVVTLEVRFDPPGGALGRTAAEYLAFVPKGMERKALHYFKSLAETGEVPTTAGQPAARPDTR